MGIRVVSLEDQKKKKNQSGLRGGETISSSSGNRVTSITRNDYDPVNGYYYVTGANGDVIRNGAPGKIGGAIIYINDDGRYHSRGDYDDGDSNRSYSGGWGSGGYSMPDFSFSNARREAESAINARVQQVINGYEGQRSGISQSALDAARQAFINKEQSIQAAPQQMAAMGNSGGLAESSLMGINADYENSRNAIVLNRDNAIRELETNINNAKLEGAAAIANSNSKFDLEEQKLAFEAKMAEEQRRFQEEQALKKAQWEQQLRQQDYAQKKGLAEFQNLLDTQKEQAPRMASAQGQAYSGNDGQAANVYRSAAGARAQQFLNNLFRNLYGREEEFNRTIRYAVEKGEIMPSDVERWLKGQG